MSRPVKKPATHRKLRIEALEVRNMMAANLTATLVNNVLTIEGTERADLITVHQVAGNLSIDNINIRSGSTNVRSVAANAVKSIEINALGGDDTIRLNSEATSGQQPLYPKSVVFGGAGNDTILGGYYNNYIDGGAGNDTIYGGASVDEIYGDLGNDLIYGQGGSDTLVGGDGNDSIFGGDGNDLLDGGRGFDYLYGQNGGDSIYDDAAGNIRDGGAAYNSITDGHWAWFDMNVSDAALRSFSRTRFADRMIDHTDMLSIFGEAGKDNYVSSTELADLRKMVAQGDSLRMTEDVRVLSGKVVNSDVANATYQGKALGNLYAGSTSTQLTNLVNKWFKGLDRPDTTLKGVTYSYVYANGSLFINGASPSDIHQGLIGDCYLMAPLAATAQQTPSVIANMFVDNGDGTYAVRFYINGTADYVTVDRFLPVDRSGTFVFANTGSVASGNNELWVALAEKAYAQMNQGGKLDRAAANSYAGIRLGDEKFAIRQVTGRGTQVNTFTDANTLIAAINSGAVIVAATNAFTVSNPEQLFAGHGYAVTAYDARTKTFTLVNPYAGDRGRPATVKLTFAQLQKDFLRWSRSV